MSTEKDIKITATKPTKIPVFRNETVAQEIDFNRDGFRLDGIRHMVGVLCQGVAPLC